MAAEEECALSGVTVLKGNRVGVALSLGVSLLCFASLVFFGVKAGMPHTKDFGDFVRVMILGMIGGGVGSFYFGRISRKPSDLSGELRATRNGVYVRGKRLVARREISRAYVWPGTGVGTLVRIERKGLLGGPIDLKVKDVDEGRALLHALGLDATQSATEYSVAGPSRGHWRKRLYFCWAGTGSAFASLIALGVLHRPLALGGVASAAVGTFAALAYAVSMLQLFWQSRVVVGADGVYVRWLWQKRFIPIEEIASVSVVEGDYAFNGYPIYVRMKLKSGPDVDLFVQFGRKLGGRSTKLGQFTRMRAEILAERISEALTGGGKGSSSVLEWDASLLAQGERAIEEWVGALRGIAAKTATFREPGAIMDQLWTVLEDVQAPAEKRAAAAVALSPHLDEGGRERVRLAAQATVAPKLRIALEAAADDDDDRLVSALDGVADAKHARVSSSRAASEPT